MLSEQNRAAAMAALGEEIIALIATRVADLGGDDGDTLSIGAAACSSIAVAFVATKAVDAPAAIALVGLLAESAARDIYG